MSAELVKRADTLRADFAAKEATKDSGFHNDDYVMRGDKARFVAPHRQPALYHPDKTQPRMSECVVHFTDHDDDEVQVFAGADAEKVMAAAKAWAQDAQSRPYNVLTGRDRTLLHRIVPRLKLDTSGGVPALRVRMGDWNDLLFLIHYQNLAVAGLPLKG